MSNSKAPSFDSVRVGDIADCYHVTRRTVNDWLDAGCPRNRNKSMSIYQVHKWLLARAESKGDSSSLKDRKTEKEIERLEAQISKINEKTVDKDFMDQVLAIRAKSLSSFLETAAVKNSIHYVGKTLQEVQNLRFREAQESMETYLGKR